ncbi:MAG TPA: 4'-phosphopantetheinyl transferase superfamily protein [Burkholderiaceae bacterium]|nr:4'-phosphopantetheinyl transferase superfamily protein [Burkholderiaceae bacterium]
MAEPSAACAVPPAGQSGVSTVTPQTGPVPPLAGPAPPAGVPLALPPGVQGVYVIAVAADGADRPAQRVRVRAALAQLAARVLGVPLARITIASPPGQRPRIVLSGADGRGQSGPTPGCAISHEDGLSLAALHLHGAVGVDLMRPQPVPDWAQLAHDYLGPQVASALAASPPARRPQALAQAWTAREAALKCRGLGLSEWTPAAPDGHCRLHPLTLPEGYVGTLALA